MTTPMKAPNHKPPASTGRSCLSILFLSATLSACGGSSSDVVPTSGGADTDLTIKVLSSRADTISAGDALVEVTGDPDGLKMQLDGVDITDAFGMRPNGRVQALLTGLKLGPNILTVRRKDRSGASLTIMNHPTGGPVFSGPQLQPWICATEAAGLALATDAQCNAPVRITWLYKASGATPLQAYDPANPPRAVASTTTDQGITVPFIVRVERGVINRGVYEYAVLADPEQPPAPWNPPKGWNGKLYWFFGGNTSNNHVQPEPGTVAQSDSLLGRGFATAASGLTNQGSNPNNVVAAETLMMIKERIIETIGPIRYTVAEGYSGGAIQQQTIANNYPGLLNGLRPSGSFPDLWEVYQQAEDCHLLQRYFINVAPLMWVNILQQLAVTGSGSPTECLLWDPPGDGGFAQAFADPANASSCSLPAEQVYNAQTNPTGVRCTLQDSMVSLFGTRTSDGFAHFPYDNAGVQYGLNAVNGGTISPEQFLDLNEKIGGLDIDWNPQPARSNADPAALQVMYGAGLVNSATEAVKVPIIDLRPNDPLTQHTNVHSYVMRERLKKANGHADNQIIWTSDLPLITYSTGDPSLDLLDSWLASIEADTAAGSPEEKVLRNKPAEAVDACWIAGVKLTDLSLCNTLFPPFATPRIAAGAPLSNDVVKCQLKPLSRDDYTIQFTDDQWARLQGAFPHGVCDYSLPSIGYQKASPWMSFAKGPGGIPLGAPPVSAPFL